MTVNEIRNRFLKYMESKGHAIVPSSPLTPENDPTTLFTGSGMQPMLPYLLGQPHPLGTRIADSQKCFRSQDIEEVGDNRHTTFFEMLGNWSFGDYFKEEQIKWMWEFLTSNEEECLGLDVNNFYITCFKGNEILAIPKDTFSAELWQKLFKEKGIEALVSNNPEIGMKFGERIFYYSEKKNWWSRSGVPSNMPEGEPGGPDSEMFYDFDPIDKNGKHIYNTHGKSSFADAPCHPNCDCGRFLEIGNNVFMQYKKTSNGFEELPQMNVDHGSGLERYAAALRNDPDIFNTDVFDRAKEIIEAYTIGDYRKNPDISNAKKYGQEVNITYAYRVILDHIRAAVFLIGDGVVPGNKDQMYFVRRLIRRAVRFGKNIGIELNFTKEVAESFINTYWTSHEFAYLFTKKELILSEIDKEESKFRKTLEKGLRIIKNSKLLSHTKIQGQKIVIQDNPYSGMDENDLKMLSDRDNFTGKWLFDLNQSYGFPFELAIEELSALGEIYGENHIRELMSQYDLAKKQHQELSRTASAGKFKGGLGGDGVMEVKYHTATHLLHEALRQVLGESVTQKGSNITSERLRFDFAYDRKVTDEEKKKVEDIVNEVIQQALPVTREEISYDEARARGAIGLFGDKYGEKVSVYTVGFETGKRGMANLFSLEFCGGPHVHNTSELGIFTIQKEEAVSAGVRRMKAVLV